MSTSDQRLGPDAQRQSIEAWAASNGVQVVASHVDQGVSGGSDLDDRPGLVAALADLRLLGAGVLAVAKRDRLARDVYVASTIERAVERCGARIVAADGTANGETPADAFMRSILDAAAAYERSLIKARTVAALAVLRARGKRVGAVPYGYRLGDDDKTLVRDDDEQAAVSEIRKLRAAGFSYRAIQKATTARSRNGRPLSIQAIFAIASRAEYALPESVNGA